LRELESKYPEELVVIGVQSGKYHAERITSRIRDASLRLNATHPVLNDRQFRTWRSYAVSAWPTLVAIDPAGYVVGAHAGEFTAEMLQPFIDGLIDTARTRGTLKPDAVHYGVDQPTTAPENLRYPGKVAIDGNRIAIADSGNNRIIIARLDENEGRAKIEMTVGSGAAGFENGLEGSFHSPQGLCFDGDVLFVADAENHAVRAIHLADGSVSTVAGIGRQLRTRGDQREGAMSSPCDVVVVGDTIFAAMAGTHQLWSIDKKTGESRVHAGTGGEDIRDGENRNSLLAQPMGITSRDNKLFFADSESNAVRWSDLAQDGSVGTIVGTGLFDFGDVDGSGDDVRLQHPQGIAIHPEGGLLVADSYNDCIKLVDPDKRSSSTWLRELHEPEGIACSSTHAFVADTNAHRVVVADLRTREVRTLRLE
jgi:NHL repeat.